MNPIMRRSEEAPLHPFRRPKENALSRIFMSLNSTLVSYPLLQLLSNTHFLLKLYLMKTKLETKYSRNI